MKLLKLLFLSSLLLTVQVTFSSDSDINYLDLRDVLSEPDEIVEAFNVFDEDCENDLIFYLLSPDKFRTLRSYVERYPASLEALECHIVENPLYFAVSHPNNQATVELLLQKGVYPYFVPHHGIHDEYRHIFDRYED